MTNGVNITAFNQGTSGPPKCIVHSAGVSIQIARILNSLIYRFTQGVLLQTKKDIGISFNLTADDTYFQYTTVRLLLGLLGLGAQD